MMKLVIFNGVVRADLPEEVTFEKGPQEVRE